MNKLALIGLLLGFQLSYAQQEAVDFEDTLCGARIKSGVAMFMITAGPFLMTYPIITQDPQAVGKFCFGSLYTCVGACHLIGELQKYYSQRRMNQFVEVEIEAQN